MPPDPTTAARRSWTDNTTNSIFVEGLNASAYLKWLLSRDLNGAFLVPQFIHEYTHHWCFQTTVGATVALIDLRLHALSNAFPDGRAVWARDWIANYTITTLLRPLAEGLALFSEFDAIKSRDVRQATPIGAAELCFAMKDGDIYAQLMLQQLRYSPSFLDRKASLYLKNFEIVDGYLPGYMAVKNLYASIIARKPSIDSELFLSYIRSFFWEDAGFTNLLISEEMDGGVVAGALEERFQKRFASLFTDSDLPKKLDAFWEKWSHPGQKLFTHEIGITDEEAKLAVDRTSQTVYHSLDLIASAEDSLEQATGIDSGELEELFRSLAVNRSHVVVARANVKVDSNRIAFETSDFGDTGAVAESGQLPGLLPPAGSYEYYAIIPTYATYLATLFRDDNASIYLSGIVAPDPTKVDYNQLEIFARKWPRLFATTRKLREQFERIGFPALRSKTLDDMTGALSNNVLGFYTAAAALRVADDSGRAEFRRTLKLSGLKHIFGKDAMGLRAIAGLSLLDPKLGEIHGYLTEGQLVFLKLYYFPEIDAALLSSALARIATSDANSIIVRQTGDQTAVLL